MKSDAVDLQQFVGKTFERDGECFVVDQVDVDVAVIEWVIAGKRASADVPHSMLRLWLAGAVEVKGDNQP